MKKIILRSETLRRVKKCDGKLSNLIQTFQVCRRPIVRFTGVTYYLQIALAIDARLEQIKVNKSRCDSDQHEDQTDSNALVRGDSDSC